MTAVRVIAEVAEDDVRADNADGGQQRWREVEVELVDNDDTDLLAALGDVARRRRRLAVIAPVEARAGHRQHEGDVPAHRPAEARAGVGGSSGRRLLETAGCCAGRRRPGGARRLEDAVHKMRVAVRRLRSALATYRRLLDRDETDALRDELKWLGGVLGPVRDAEVIRDHLDAAVQAEPASLRRRAGPAPHRLDAQPGPPRGPPAGPCRDDVGSLPRPDR